MSDPDEIIIGDEQVAIVQANIGLVNPQMVAKLNAIIAKYEASPGSVTLIERLYFANCEEQIAFILA
jgi:hypothetical protein